MAGFIMKASTEDFPEMQYTYKRDFSAENE